MMRDLTEEEEKKLFTMFDAIYGYQQDNKSNNESISELKADFVESIFPDTVVKLKGAAKEQKKEAIKELRTFIQDSYQSYKRTRNAKVDTMPEAVAICAKHLKEEREKNI